MSNHLTLQVKSFAMEQDAKLVGIADANLFDHAPKGHKPTDILQDAKAVIVIAIPQPKAIISDALTTEYTRCIFTTEIKLELAAFNIANFLDEKGYKAIPIPVRMDLMMDKENLMGDLSHKHAAVLAGLGQIGKNSLLITPEYGNRVYLSSIVTNAPLIPDKPFDKELCSENCFKCVKACPIQAISKNGKVNKAKCYAYCKTERDKYPLTQGVYSCRICRQVCPFSK